MDSNRRDRANVGRLVRQARKELNGVNRRGHPRFEIDPVIPDKQRIVPSRDPSVPYVLIRCPRCGYRLAIASIRELAPHEIPHCDTFLVRNIQEG